MNASGLQSKKFAFQQSVRQNSRAGVVDGAGLLEFSAENLALTALGRAKSHEHRQRYQQERKHVHSEQGIYPFFTGLYRMEKDAWALISIT
jgi:hypothetical protein